MKPLIEAPRLLRGQTELEEAICRPGGIRVMEGRELYPLPVRLQKDRAAVRGASEASNTRAARSRRAPRTVASPLPALMIVFGAAQPALADETMRCGNWVIEAPTSAEDLLSKCGAPSKKEVITEDVRASGRSGGSRAVGTTTVERWTYKSDGQSLTMIATVIDGKVTKIARDE